MEPNRNLVATALVAFFAAGAYAGCPGNPNPASAVALTALTAGTGIPRDLHARQKADSVPESLVAPIDSDRRKSQDRTFVHRAAGDIPPEQISAARSAERRFEHREPPPRHLVATRRCKDADLDRPITG